MFRSPGLWDRFDSDSMLGKGDQLFKFIGKSRYLRMEDLPQEFFVEITSINMEFLENKTGGNSSIYLFDFHSKDEKTTYRILVPHFF